MLVVVDWLWVWLLFVDGELVVYLCCIVDGMLLCYDYVGYDLVYDDLLLGVVL